MMLAAFRNFYLLAEVLEWLSRQSECRFGEIQAAVNQHYPQWNNPETGER